jgi:hypothetical protein
MVQLEYLPNRFSGENRIRQQVVSFFKKTCRREPIDETA